LAHTAVCDRLVFDFPHNVLCLFIFFETDKDGVPQVIVGRPLGKLNLRDQFRL
jgi:hypothetical protein